MIRYTIITWCFFHSTIHIAQVTGSYFLYIFFLLCLYCFYEGEETQGTKGDGRVGGWTGIGSPILIGPLTHGWRVFVHSSGLVDDTLPITLVKKCYR